MPTTPPPVLSVHFPTPSSFSARRARSHTISGSQDAKPGLTLSAGGLQAALDAPAPLRSAIALPASAKRAPPRPLSLHVRSGSNSQHTSSALLSPYGAPAPPTTGGQPKGRHTHTPRHSVSGGLPSAGLPTGTAAGVARQRGLAIAVVKHGDNNVVMTPGLPSAALKSAGLRSAGVQPLGSARSSEDAPGSGRKEAIILCKYFHTPGLTCTSRPCRFVHDLKTQNQSSTSPLPSPSLYSMLSPTAIPSPTAGTFALAQAAAPLRRLSMKQETLNEDGLARLTIGETVIVHDDEQGEDVVGEVYVMSGGGAGLAGKTNKKFKTEPCRDFLANGDCPYGEYCSFLHDEVKPKSKPADAPTSAPKAKTEAPLSVADKRERSAPGFNAWLAKIPKSVYDPQPGGQWAEDAEGEPSTTALKPKSVNAQAQAFEPPAKLRKPSAWTTGPPASMRPKALDLRERLAPNEGGNTLVTPSLSSGMKSSTVEPPQSAFGTDSDPATPWNPALAYERERQQAEDDAKAAAFAVAHAGMDDSSYQDSNQPALSDLSWEGYLVPPPSIAGVAVVWTEQGWTVQEAAAAAALESLDPAGGKGRKPKSYYRTRPCKFFNEGFCPHGETCSYQHIISKPSSPSPPSEPELMTPGEGKRLAFGSSSRSDDGSQAKRPHPLHKTQPCKFFNSATGCTNGDDCAFLHEHVLPVHAPIVAKPRPWRTRPCRHFQTSTCHAGDLCHFAHVADPLFKPSAAHLHRDPLDPNVSPAKPCSHWVRTGKCSFGEKCKFNHPTRRKQSVDDQPHLLPSAPVVLWPVTSADGSEDESDSDDDDVEIEINSIPASPLRV